MEKLQTIVVGVAEMHDLHPEGAPAGEDPVLAPAAVLADRLGATLHVVLAIERVEAAEGASAGVAQRGDALQHRRARSEHRVWAASRRFPNAQRIHCQTVEGDAAIQLCAFAEEVEADLLIVGGMRRLGSSHNYLGSTAERVLQRSAIPVLVMRQAFAEPVRRVLLTTDLSTVSPALHEVALDAVESLLGTEALEVCTLVVCWYDVATSARISRATMERAATWRLDRFLVDRQARRYPVAGKVRIGNPSTEILRETGDWKADLLVLGSHGRWGISQAPLGSTAAATLRGARCNALVIPARRAAVWQASSHGATGGEENNGFPGTEEHAKAGAFFVSA